MLPLIIRQLKNKCLKTENQGKTNLQQIRKLKKVEEVYGGNYTIDVSNQSTTRLTYSFN
jgi:hypothetical protein